MSCRSSFIWQSTGIPRVRGNPLISAKAVVLDYVPTSSRFCCFEGVATFPLSRKTRESAWVLLLTSHAQLHPQPGRHPGHRANALPRPGFRPQPWQFRHNLPFAFLQSSTHTHTRRIFPAWLRAIYFADRNKTKFLSQESMKFKACQAEAE